MAKIRKIPAAYEGTRGVPAQYTTDPDVATPEQVAAIGSALDKARKLSRGQRITKSMVGAAPIPTTPVRLNRTSGSTLRSPAGASNLGIGGGAPIATAPAAFNATSKSPQKAGNALK